MIENRHSICQAALDHFEAIEIKIIEVPEWGTDEKPAMIYVKPLTMNEKKPLFKKMQKNDLDAFIDLLVKKCKDATENPIFTLADKPAMRGNMDPTVIERIANDILDVPSIEDAEKN